MTHGPYSDDRLRDILLRTRTIAMVGASPKAERPSHGVMRFLLAAGYRVIPVNPASAGGEILGQRACARLADIGEPVDMVDVFRASRAAGGVVDEALALSPLPETIWMQIGVRDEAAAARAEAAGVEVVMDHCLKAEFLRLGLTAGSLKA